MAIQIHIRVKETDWESENELAYLIADGIQAFITENVDIPNVNIPILVLPVEDKGNEMEPLIK
jgi:hypothetical protein